jgi:type VI secretion system protein ImpE
MQVDRGSKRRSLADEIASAMEAIRAAPQSMAPRMALFQLDCVTGNWVRARTQLTTMAHLDAEAMMLARLYEQLIQSETEREDVFAGRKRPVVLGPPTPWLAMMAQGLEHDAAGERDASRDLRARARAEAPARPGTLDGTAFTWIMDADPRLGPTLEVVVDGQYRWLPFEHIRRLRADAPAALRDLVWQPVALTLANDSDVKAFVPARYPNSAGHADDAVRLARTSIWVGPDQDQQIGCGQRLLATDVDDYPILAVRKLDFEPASPGAAALG